MHILIGLVGLISAIAFWIYRARNTVDAVGEITNVANDVRLAARRFGYKRKNNVHPADSVDDARIAATGLVLAFVELEKGTVRQDDLDQMSLQAQSVFDIDKSESEGLVAVGEWINQQTNNSPEVIRRLQRRLRDLAGSSAASDLENMIAKVAGPLSEEAAQTQANMLRVLSQ